MLYKYYVNMIVKIKPNYNDVAENVNRQRRNFLPDKIGKVNLQDEIPSNSHVLNKDTLV